MIRDWASSAEVRDLPSVPGASEDELRQLAALGGLAMSFGSAAVANWPTPVLAWARAGATTPPEVVDMIQRFLEGGGDPFAEAYNACISAENRRRLGTVFTPDVVVDHVLDLAAAQLDGVEPACVIDPGAGVGAFTVAAARKWPKARIVSVDVNVVTLGLLATRLAAENEGDLRSAFDDRIELRLADFIESLPALFAPTAPGPVLVVGNPPYTRTQALPASYKSRIADLEPGLITSGHANLATLFQALTLVHLRPEDASCMVLPGSIVYTRAARDLRLGIWRSKRPATVHRWPATARAFIGRNVQAAVIVLGQEKADPGPLRLARVDDDGSQIRPIEEWELSRDGDPPTSWYSPSVEMASDDDTVPLGSAARIRRGVATGANTFFFLTDETARNLPRDAYVAAVPSLRNFGENELTPDLHLAWGGPEQRRWMLLVADTTNLTGFLKRYIAQHADVVSNRHLAKQRPTWWAITDAHRPAILLSPLTRTTFKVVLNSAGAVPSNNLIGLDPIAGDAAALANWLRSQPGQDALRRASRRYHGGSHKLEPGDLRCVRIPTHFA